MPSITHLWKEDKWKVSGVIQLKYTAKSYNFNFLQGLKKFLRGGMEYD